MLDIESIDSIENILIFLVPGIIIIFVRSKFVTGRNKPHTEQVITYLVLSIIYYAFVLPFVDIVLSMPDTWYKKLPAWFALIFVGPAVFGVLLGLDVQKNLFRRFLQRFGLNTVHVIPTAWDWKFSTMPDQWVLVTLKDGTRFCGLCSERSFMSSDPAERDIYIEMIYDIDDCNKWTPRGENGVLITAGEVQTIEFWPYTPEKDDPDD